MKSFTRYKVNASDVGDLMSREHGSNPPTDNDLKEFFRILEKDMIDITDPQKTKLQQVVARCIDYDNYSLSLTIKKNMYKIYAYAKYGASKISINGNLPLQLEKGEVGEQSAVQLLSKLDGVEYRKNEKMYSNSFLRGIPDIILEENGKIIGVKDIKVPLDLPSFIERVNGDSLSNDRWEMLSFLNILGLKQGEICYCLVDLPEKMRIKRLEEHKERMELLGVEKNNIKKRLKQIERSMIYDYIPEEQRVKRFIVERKSYFTNQIHRRVKLVREEFKNIDQNFKNPLILPQNEEQLPENID